MPVCRLFVAGLCISSACPFSHVNLGKVRKASRPHAYAGALTHAHAHVHAHAHAHARAHAHAPAHAHAHIGKVNRTHRTRGYSRKACTHA
eukprot:6205043-Pleurochrysis_carterae.AAC.1